MVQEEYGLIIYARDRTPYGGGPWATPSDENGDIQCGGALVRPGDVLVGDDDGVVVVPSWFAEECVGIDGGARGRGGIGQGADPG